METSRRNFIKSSSLAVGSLILLNAQGCGISADPNTLKTFGFQSWTIRKNLKDDFEGTLKLMAKYGYKQIEMCSPLGYSDTEFAAFNNMSGSEIRKIIEDAGLLCRSSHYNMSELNNSLENRIEWSKEMGITQMILSSFWLPKEASSIDDYRRSANQLNIIAEQTKAADIQMGFHNHHMEFEKRGNELIYDVLLDELDPELVKMQFQVAVANIGYKAADYFRKYPGRFISAHLSDWNTTKDTQVPIGQGIVDWNDFFDAAKIGGVKNVFVEMAPDTFKESAEFLKNR